MTILYLTEDYLHSKVHNNLLTQMLKQDESLHVYVFTPTRNRTGVSLESSFQHHERLIEVTAPIDIPLNIYRADFWAKIRCKVRLIEKHIPIKEIDVVHAATLFTEGCTARSLQKKYGIPYFVSMRGTDTDFYAQKMIHLWSKSHDTIEHANALAYVTPTIKRKMMECWQYKGLRSKLEAGDIINNGIDTVWIDNLHADPQPLNKEINVLYIGRFDANKNVMRLIEAVKGLREKYPIRITLVGGDGEQQQQVEKEVSVNSDYITCLGKIYDKQELMKVVRTCDIFAMVSHGETFGLVYAECMTQGLPLLYTIGTGFDNIYPQGHIGYGVDSYSVDSIQKGLDCIIQNYSEIRERVAKVDFNRFSWSGIAKSYIYIYAAIKSQRWRRNGSRDTLKSLFYFINSLARIPSDFFNHNKVHSTTRIANESSLKFCTIGKHNYIARRNSLYNVEVGNYCCFGPDVHIGGMQHSYWWYSMSPLLSDKCKSPERTIIGNDVWIGAQAIIKQGVKIGHGAVIGANSFVNKDVEPFSIVVGSPAKHIKYRFGKDIQEAIIQSSYWSEEPTKAKEILKSLKLL